MGEMAMELAHEIRNPLASIELYASMLDGHDAEQIVRSVRLLNHTVTNTLQFGKPVDPALRLIDVFELLQGVTSFMRPIADQKKVAFETACDRDCHMLADPELLHRMLLNLVLNALRETPSKGTIRIAAKQNGDDVFISVEDSGAGIPRHVIERIFDPMFSTHREGCGLGLSIVKRIVESHNGSIDVMSSADGTTFNIRFKNAVSNMEVVSEPVTCS
jgi:signal transduction histidine kinase